MSNLDYAEGIRKEQRVAAVPRTTPLSWTWHGTSSSIRNRSTTHRLFSLQPSSMARESDLAGSREGLLKTDYEASLASPDEAYSSGSELDLDELEPHEEPTSPRLRGGWSPSKRNRKQKQRPAGLPSKREGGWLRNNKPLFIISAILLGGLLAILGMLFGGAFRKPGAPPDGVSERTS